MNKELEVNKNLSHYRIVKQIGACATGEVYPAENAKPERLRCRAFMNQPQPRLIRALNFQITARKTSQKIPFYVFARRFYFRLLSDFRFG